MIITIDDTNFMKLQNSRVIFRENTKVNIVVNLCSFMNVFVMSFKGHITCKRVVTNVANKFFHFFMNNVYMILKNIWSGK